MSVFEGREIGERISQARKEKGLRQEDLAPLVGVSTRSIQGYELGETSPYKHLRAISEVLGRPVEWFLRGDENTGPTPEVLTQLLEEARGNRLLLETILQQIAILESELQAKEARPSDAPEPV